LFGHVSFVPVFFQYMEKVKEKASIRVSKRVETEVQTLARRDRISPSAKLDSLVRFAIDLDEDAALGALADERLKNATRTVSHAKAWK